MYVFVCTFFLQISGSTEFKPIICVENSCICDTRQDKESDPLRTWVRTEVSENFTTGPLVK